MDKTKKTLQNTWEHQCRQAFDKLIVDIVNNVIESQHGIESVLNKETIHNSLIDDLQGDFSVRIDVNESMPRVMQHWDCFVCGNCIKENKDTLLLCDDKSCHQRLGIVEAHWDG